jgi:hypothetical protein
MKRTIVVLLVLAARAECLPAAPNTFSGLDAGANSSDPRPNSDAAATSFATAATALGPTSLITFESAPVGSFNNLEVVPGVVIDGTDANSADQTIRDSPFVMPDAVWGYNTTPAGRYYVMVFGGDLTFSFAPPIQSFGAYISGQQFLGQTITFSDGSSQSVPIPSGAGGVAFVGFVAPGAHIASVTINTIFGDIDGVDDVRFGVVPEPADIVLAGSAALTWIGWRQRRGRIWLRRTQRPGQVR